MTTKYLGQKIIEQEHLLYQKIRIRFDKTLILN